MKFMRWSHPRRPIARELTARRCQSYPARAAPIAVNATRNSGPAMAPQRSWTGRLRSVRPTIPAHPRNEVTGVSPPEV